MQRNNLIVMPAKGDECRYDIRTLRMSDNPDLTASVCLTHKRYCVPCDDSAIGAGGSSLEQIAEFLNALDRKVLVGLRSAVEGNQIVTYHKRDGVWVPVPAN